MMSVVSDEWRMELNPWELIENLDCWSCDDLRIFTVVFKNLVSSAEEPQII